MMLLGSAIAEEAAESDAVGTVLEHAAEPQNVAVAAGTAVLGGLIFHRLFCSKGAVAAEPEAEAAPAAAEAASSATDFLRPPLPPRRAVCPLRRVGVAGSSAGSSTPCALAVRPLPHCHRCLPWPTHRRVTIGMRWVGAGPGARPVETLRAPAG